MTFDNHRREPGQRPNPGPMRTAAAGVAALLLTLLGSASAAAGQGERADAASLTSFLASLPDDAADALGATEGDDPNVQSPEEVERELERERAGMYQAVEQFSRKKLSNMRICFSLYSHFYREIKQGSAGWGNWDELFSSGWFATRTHLGEQSVWLPTGGFEISYVCTPLYQVSMGFSYDIYTGGHFQGNRFDDLRISSYSLGLKFNLLNQYTALQQFAEMFNFEQPKHITGLNIYVRGYVALAIIQPVLFDGNSVPPGQSDAHYFKHGTTLGTFVAAGLEYRLFTIGLFFEVGFSEIRRPPMGPDNLEANHLRTFPVQGGINVYFGG